MAVEAVDAVGIVAEDGKAVAGGVANNEVVLLVYGELVGLLDEARAEYSFEFALTVVFLNAVVVGVANENVVVGVYGDAHRVLELSGLAAGRGEDAEGVGQVGVLNDEALFAVRVAEAHSAEDAAFAVYGDVCRAPHVEVGWPRRAYVTSHRVFAEGCGAVRYPGGAACRCG